MNRDEQDVVGIINRQLTLPEAAPASGVATAGDLASTGSATPPAAGQTTADAALERSAEVQDSTASAQPEVIDSVASAQEGVDRAVNGLLDGLKIVAQNAAAAEKSREERLSVGQAPVVFDTADSPACTDCGSIMVRNGSCYKCINCGATSGCS
jgi:ribonucleoside-diphosphate reductase alpha chain